MSPIEDLPGKPTQTQFPTAEDRKNYSVGVDARLKAARAELAAKSIAKTPTSAPTQETLIGSGPHSALKDLLSSDQK